MKKTINQLWKENEPSLVPEEAGDEQRRDMKRMFFAGFAVALQYLGAEIGNMPEEEGVIELERKNKELRGYTEAIKLGAA